MTGPYRAYLVKLTARRTPSPSFVRITLRGADLGSCSPTLLDQRVKLVIGTPDVLRALAASDDGWYDAWLALPDGDRPAMRTYTLADVRAERDGAGEVDIDVATHPLDDDTHGSPGLRFSLDAATGTEVILVAADRTKDGHDHVGVAWHPKAARDVLLVGDETALPAIVNILGSLPADATGRAVLDVPHDQDVRSVSAPEGVRVEWRVRSRGERAIGLFGRPADSVDESDTLLWDEVDGEGGRYGWVAGEAGWVRELRAEAKAAGVPRGQVAFMGYWKRGEVS